MPLWLYVSVCWEDHPAAVQMCPNLSDANNHNDAVSRLIYGYIARLDCFQKLENGGGQLHSPMEKSERCERIC